MKTAIKLSAIIFFFLTTVSLMAQEEVKPKKKVDEVKIQTSAICGMCKDRIEHELAYTKGVKYAELDPDTKVVKIEYKTNKTNPEKLRKVISNIGYDADDVPANKEAHDQLPACCQKGNEPH